MSGDLPKFHTLDVEYNGLGPFTAVSSERGGISVTIGTHTLAGAMSLYISYRIDKNTTKHYVLNFLRPGDRLKFTYDGPSIDSGTSIDRIEDHERPNSFQLRAGLRFGFDVVQGETTWRLSHPEAGGLSLSISNVPLDHARVWTAAGNDHEEWSWQHDDLYAGDCFEIEIVETDWCDEFPKVQKKTIAPDGERKIVS